MKTWMKIGLGILVIIIGFAIYYAINEFTRGHPDYAKAKPELTIKAKRLYTEFSQNAEQANEKFCGRDGKIIQIEGKITKVEATDSLAVLVYVFDEGDFGDKGIRVTMLPEFTDLAKRTSSVRHIKVKGLCTGFSGDDVIVDKGSFVE